jgi:hypothetical protein
VIDQVPFQVHALGGNGTGVGEGVGDGVGEGEGVAGFWQVMLGLPGIGVIKVEVSTSMTPGLVGPFSTAAGHGPKGVINTVSVFAVVSRAPLRQIDISVDFVRSMALY